MPAAKRRFGYYCLPILYGTGFVGRLDPKADRLKSEFRINSLYLEKPVGDEERFATALAEKLKQTAAFNGCSRIIFKPGERNNLNTLLARKLEQ